MVRSPNYDEKQRKTKRVFEALVEGRRKRSDQDRNGKIARGIEIELKTLKNGVEKSI